MSKRTNVRISFPLSAGQATYVLHLYLKLCLSTYEHTDKSSNPTLFWLKKTIRKLWIFFRIEERALFLVLPPPPVLNIGPAILQNLECSEIHDRIPRSMFLFVDLNQLNFFWFILIDRTKGTPLCPMTKRWYLLNLCNKWTKIDVNLIVGYQNLLYKSRKLPS